MYNQWATAPGLSINYPRPKSITHLRTFSDNGVYVALQLFLVIVVSDQWRRVLIPLSRLPIISPVLRIYEDEYQVMVHTKFII